MAVPILPYVDQEFGDDAVVGVLDADAVVVISVGDLVDTVVVSVDAGQAALQVVTLVGGACKV